MTLNGIVELDGFVRTAEQSQDAEKIAQSVPYVKGVLNNLVVAPHVYRR